MGQGEQQNEGLGARQPGGDGSNPLTHSLAHRNSFEEETENEGLNPVGIAVRALRGRSAMVGMVALGLGLLLAILAFSVVSPYYQSFGLVRVLPREERILFEDMDDSHLRLYDAFTNIEMQMIRSHPVLETALQSIYSKYPGIEEAIKDEGDLSDALVITNKKGLITLSAQTRNAELSSFFVNAILTSYEENHRTHQKRKFEIRRDKLMNREQSLSDQLDVLSQEYLTIGQEHDLNTLANAHAAKIDELAVVGKRITELKDNISSIKAKGTTGADISDPMIQRAVLLDRVMADMSYERTRVVSRVENLKGRYTKSHPNMMSASRELAALDAAIHGRRDQVVTLSKSGALTGGSQKQSLTELINLQADLLDRRELTKEEALELNQKRVRIRALQDDTIRTQRWLDDTKIAIDQLMVESSAELSRAVEVVSKGKVPGKPFKDKRKPAAVGAFLVGSGGGVLGFVLLSFIRGRVGYSDGLRQVERDHLAVVMPVSSDLPKDGLKLSVNRLRNQIDVRLFPGIVGQSMVIAMSSIEPLAGTSTITDALGKMYALSGKKVLIVDLGGADGLLNESEGLLKFSSIASRREQWWLESVAEIEGFDGLLSKLTLQPESKADGVTGQRCLWKEDWSDLIVELRQGFDVVLLDLGCFEQGRTSEVATNLSDLAVLTISADSKRKTVEKKMALLERMNFWRYLIVLNKASILDPELDVEGTPDVRPRSVNNLWTKVKFQSSEFLGSIRDKLS